MSARSSSPKRAARPERTPAPAPSPARMGARVVPLQKSAATLMAATPLAFDEPSNLLTVRVGIAELSARLDPSVSPIVARGALERGETLIVVDVDGLVVLGALRTAPTPGLDRGEEYVIEAKRLQLLGSDRVVIASGAAQIFVSALDRIEILAQDITSRARRVHKLVGRMLHLN